ncbi:hypothetical protein A2U01_0049392, partial [Trifolium medium]|nr:hypothetical protein [Trifolium medium]
LSVPSQSHVKLCPVVTGAGRRTSIK